MRSIVAMIVVAVALTGAYAEVTIVAGGEARAVIITPAEPAPVAQYAAEELAWHIEKATGVVVPILPENEEPDDLLARVYVGAVRAAYDAEIPVDDLDGEATVLLTVDDALFIVGDDDDGDPLDLAVRAGTLWGVYEVLERVVGVRWLWPGELGMYAPKMDAVTIPDLDERFTPDLLQRKVRPGIIKGKDLITTTFSDEALEAYKHDQAVFMRRHRQGQVHPLRYGHAFHWWWEAYGEEHPEWFQLLDNGKRGPASAAGAWNVAMCVSNPEFHQKIIADWQAWLAENPGQWRNVNACENDCGGRCVCEPCLAWDAADQQGLTVAEGRSTSARYARFWKAVHELAVQADPDAIVTAYAYNNYRFPPTEPVELNENIFVGYVPNMYFPRSDGQQERILGEWDGWRATGARMFYRPNYLLIAHCMPLIYSEQMLEELQHMYRNGLVATDYDSCPGAWGTMGPLLYTLLRFHTRPEQSAADSLAEYCEGFGPAAGQVREYFEFWESHVYDTLLSLSDRDRSGRLFWLFFAKNDHVIFPLGAWDEAGRILARAEAVAGDADEFAGRVGFLRTGWEHGRLCTEISELLAGANPDVSPLAVYGKLADLSAFRAEHEMEYFANLTFTSFIESRSWTIPERYQREDLRMASHDVAPLAGTPVMSTRGGHQFVAWLDEGESFRARLACSRAGANPAASNWHLIGPDDEMIARGSVQPDETAEIDVPAQQAGVHLLLLQTNRNYGRITLLNDHAACASRSVSFIGGASPMYFRVPDGLQSFHMTVSSPAPGECARIAVLDPDGNEAGAPETGDLKEVTVEIAVPAGQAGNYWSVRIDPPTVGVLEDYTITLGDELPAYWAHAADRLVVPAE